MKKPFVFVFSLLLAGYSYTQSISNYTFSTGTTESLVDMSTGSTTLIGASQVLTASAVTNIGFDVFFVGTYFNQFSVNANSVLRFGPVAVVGAGNAYNIPGNSRVIALAGTNTGSGDQLATFLTGKVHYKVIGAAPDRTLVVEWLNMEILNGSGSPDGTFQIRVHESAPGSANPGRIDIVYGTIANATGTSFWVGMGIGSGATQHVGINTSAFTSTLGSTPTNVYGTGVITDLSSVLDGSRRFFSYNNNGNPPNGAPTNLTIDCISESTASLSWNGTVTNESAYVIYRSDDGGATYNYHAQLSTATTSYTDVGLSPNTTYFYRVYFLSEGVLSALSGTGQASTTTLATTTIYSIGSGNWTNAAIWSSGAVPTSGGDVVVGCGGAHNVTVNTTALSRNLTIESGSNLSVNSGQSLTVNGDFINNGSFNLLGQALTINGDYTNSATGTLSRWEGTVTLNGSAEQTLRNSGTTIIQGGEQVFSVTGSSAIVDIGNAANGNNVPAAATLLGCGGCANLSLTVPAGSYFSLFSMNVSLTHTYNDDINMYLISPDNTVFVIATDVGGSSDNFTNVTFVDTASGPPPDASAIAVNGFYQPEGVALSSYTGTFVGTWILYVVDDASGDQGTLTDFGITLTEASTSTNLHFDNLIINNSSATGVVLADSVHLSTQLTLNDGFVFSSPPALLIIEDDATTTAGSAVSFVDGLMKKVGNDAFVFPLGNNGKWARLGISDLLNGPTPTDEFTATYFFNGHPQSFLDSSLFPGDNDDFYNVSVVEYWDLSRNTGNAQPKVTLFWEDNAVSYIDNTSDLRIAHNTGGNTWVNEGGVFAGTLAAGSITTTTNLSSFSPLTLGSLSSFSNPLPIELLYFVAKKRDALVDLFWETTSEINNAFFQVERSADAVHFEAIQRINGAGNSSAAIQYSTTDDVPLHGTSYYRLKQTDYDGQYSYSGIVAVRFNEEALRPVVYPNPVHVGQSIYISNLTPNMPLSFTLFSVDGMVIQDNIPYSWRSTNEVHIDLNDAWKAGLYLLNWNNGMASEHAKIVVN
jgi:subtilisin-like proprotein convertase family protein